LSSEARLLSTQVPILSWTEVSEEPRLF